MDRHDSGAATAGVDRGGPQPLRPGRRVSAGRLRAALCLAVMALAGGLFPDHVSSPLSVAAAQAQPARRDGAPAAAPYAREDLASDAVRLEARLKREAGEGARRPLAQLRSAVDAALARRQWDAALAAGRDAVAG
ncbi:hypothetical protein ACFOEX_13360, partial [Camelimonas abortus]